MYICAAAYERTNIFNSSNSVKCVSDYMPPLLNVVTSYPCSTGNTVTCRTDGICIYAHLELNYGNIIIRRRTLSLYLSFTNISLSVSLTPIISLSFSLSYFNITLYHTISHFITIYHTL